MQIRTKISCFSSLPPVVGNEAAEKRNGAKFKLYIIRVREQSSAEKGLQYTRMNKEKWVFQDMRPLKYDLVQGSSSRIRQSEQQMPQSTSHASRMPEDSDRTFKGLMSDCRLSYQKTICQQVSQVFVTDSKQDSRLVITSNMPSLCLSHA